MADELTLPHALALRTSDGGDPHKMSRPGDLGRVSKQAARRIRIRSRPPRNASAATPRAL